MCTGGSHTPGILPDCRDPLLPTSIRFGEVNNSRLYAPAWENTEALSAKAGARVIAVDRPGYGLSDHQPDPSYLFWPRLIRDLADHLQLREFAILGFSSGGPCAMACLSDACGPQMTANLFFKKRG